MRQSAFGPFKRALLFDRFLTNLPWSPLCTFSEKRGFGWPCENCHNLAIGALWEPLFWPKIFCRLCTLSAYLLENNAFCAKVLLGLSNERYFLSDCWQICLGLPLHFFRKCGFWVTLRKLPYFGATFCAKFFSSLCTLRAYKLEDNAICARVLLSLSREGYFLGYFLKISIGPPFARFQKMRVLHDLAKISITWPFVHFLSCFLPQIFSSLCTLSAYLLEDNAIFASAGWPFKRGILFGRFLKNFPWSPVCTFSENEGFGWPCENCHNLAIRALFEPLFAPNLLQSLHFKCILIRG